MFVFCGFCVLFLFCLCVSFVWLFVLFFAFLFFGFFDVLIGVFFFRPGGRLPSPARTSPSRVVPRLYCPTPTRALTSPVLCIATVSRLRLNLCSYGTATILRRCFVALVCLSYLALSLLVPVSVPVCVSCRLSFLFLFILCLFWLFVFIYFQFCLWFLCFFRFLPFGFSVLVFLLFALVMCLLLFVLTLFFLFCWFYLVCFPFPSLPLSKRHSRLEANPSNQTKGKGNTQGQGKGKQTR